jgi:hypothetical protein
MALYAMCFKIKPFKTSKFLIIIVPIQKKNIYIYTYSIIYFGFSARPLPCPTGTVSGEFDGSYNISETTVRGPAWPAWPAWRGWGWSARHQDVDIWVRHHL